MLKIPQGMSLTGMPDFFLASDYFNHQLFFIVFKSIPVRLINTTLVNLFLETGGSVQIRSTEPGGANSISPNFSETARNF